MNKRNIAIFASGSGSNAENISRHFFGSRLARVKLILTENRSAFVLERAARLGVATHIFSIKELREGSVLSLLKAEGIDFIVLAGFLKLVPIEMVAAFPNRIINIHPALLPKYGGKGMFGMHVHEAVVLAGERETGITIHFVNNNYDEGDIVFQARCPVSSSDTPEMVAEKVHALEYEHFPKVIESVIGTLV